MEDDETYTEFRADEERLREKPLADLRAQLDAANRTVEREREVYRLALEGLREVFTDLRAQLEQAQRERDAVIGVSKLAPGLLDLCVHYQQLLAENALLQDKVIELCEDEGYDPEPHLRSAPLTAAYVAKVKRLERIEAAAKAALDSLVAGAFEVYAEDGTALAALEAALVEEGDVGG